MRTAKRAVFVQQLAALRRFEPDIPMVSSLDLGPESDYGRVRVTHSLLCLHNLSCALSGC